MKNTGYVLLVFIIVTFLTTMTAVIAFVFAFAYDEGQLDNWPLTGKFFTGLLIGFEYPTFQTHKLLGYGFPTGDKFFLLIFLNIVIYSVGLTALTMMFKKKIQLG